MASSGCLKTEKIVKNTTRSGVFLVLFDEIRVVV